MPAMLRECYIAEVMRRRMQFIDDEATQSHIEKAAKWLTGNHKPGLLLHGTVGNGKTTLVRAIGSLIGVLYESLYSDRRKNVLAVSALELADIAKNQPERFDYIKKAELLAIDDVGTEPSVVKVWGNEISPFVDTIYYRYDRQKFTEEEVMKLWEHQDNPICQTALMSIYSGVRIGELLDLKKEDVHLEERYFDVVSSKTQNGIRKVPIAEKVYPFYKSWFEDTDSEYLIHRSNGEKFKYDNYHKKRFQPLMKQLGMDHTPHCCR